MPEDPLGLLLQQAAANFGAMNKNVLALSADLSAGLAQAVKGPLDALGAMAKGAGEFSAKTSTAELNRRKIFG